MDQRNGLLIGCGCAIAAMCVLLLLGSARRMVRHRIVDRQAGYIATAQYVEQEAAQSGPLRQRMGLRAGSHADDKSGEDIQIGGLKVSLWRPAGAGPFPLVIFSHGFHGSSRQSVFLMKA